MKLVIARKKHLYSVLANGHRLDEELSPEDSWKQQQDEELDKLKRNSGIRYPPIELSFPLNYLGFFAERDDSCFLAYVQIIPRDPFCFKDLSSELSRALSEKGYSFFPTVSSGAGYFIDNKGNIRVSIMESHGDTCFRDIGIGCNGARTRDFKDEKHFLRAIGELERAVNIFMQGVYSPYIASGKLTLPDSKICLNP